MIKLTDDKLKREQFLYDLFRMFENFGDQNGHGLTMVINGKYGSGKSTVLGFIEERNQSENEFNIIKYNTWENNFFENPMLPILYSISKLEKTGSKIKETAKNVVKNLPKAILGTLAGVHGVDLQPLISNENIFDEYDTYKGAIAKFKKVLADYCAKKKTILLVDELDRCLPEYQIKVLESLYHLLDIPNLIVVIALYKDQLETSIQFKFGEELNCHGYLSKFIQYEIDLPEGDAYNYIVSLMKFQTNEYDHYLACCKLADVFKAINLPIRECILITERLNLICADGQRYYYYYPFMVAVILLLKHINNKAYRMFFSEKRKDSYYNAENMELSDTLYAKFMETIKGQEFEHIFQLWLSDDGYGYGLLLHFIDLFYPVKKITIDSLAEYFKTDPTNITSRLNDHERWNFPSTINSIVDRVSAII